MWSKAAAILLPCVSFLLWANAAPTTLPLAIPTDYEVIVVGGGPSGLAALSSLGRIRRTALLIDSGEYRNAYTRLMHDVPGFDGVTPAYYRWAATQQISHYPTVNATNGTVTDIQPKANYSCFTVSVTAFDGTASSYTARKIILATGLRDVLPETPGLQENFAKGIYWCPYCDGIEHADQTMGILGPLDKAVEAAAEIVTLNRDVVIFANGTDTPEYRARADAQFTVNSSAYLQSRNIKVENRTITRITRLQDGEVHDRDPSLPTVPEHDRFNVELDGTENMERDVLFTVFDSEQRSTLGHSLGVNLVSGMMTVDRITMRTNIPGIYAVGDASTDKSTNVLHSLYTGKIAVVDIQMELEREVSRSLNPRPLVAVQETERDEHQQKIWAQVDDSSNDLLGDGL
ncbi:hypothetical protein QQZ08_005876 [Neonectria magnoliae]|uniref:FAD/NAD(P)-binding domain-containing protein n=1 Tax=Neonectria magnoliae TaxID=2732573 RepID=A0ABR1I2B6_9HYPO